jgi:hypothetical protein
MATAGKLERISKNKVLRALKSFPVTICPALIRVVSIRSKVCRSRSPLIAEAVTAGTININRINSMDVTNSYNSIKLLYWILADAFTCMITEYIFKRVTKNKIPLNRKMIRGSFMLLELTRISRL